MLPHAIKRIAIAVLFAVLVPCLVYALVEWSPPAKLPPSYEAYAVDAAATDQGAEDDAYTTIKNVVDEVGTSKSATIILNHTGGSNTTTYTLSTDETIPSNIELWIEKGAILSIDTGVTLTVNGPIDASLCQIFSGSGTVSFGAGHVEEFYAEWWGENSTPSTTDMTAEIQAAVNAAKGLGGGIVQLLSDKYMISSTITLYDGVRLLGCGDSYNATGGTGTGTVLYNTSTTTPAITVNGATGYGFEIAYMHILGNGNTDDGIYLKKTDSSVPRSARIHDLSIKNTGRDCIRLDAFSFIDVENVTLNSATNGINVTADTGANTREFLHCSNVHTSNMSGSGLSIVTSMNDCYFDGCNFGDADKGIYANPAAGGASAYNMFFNSLCVGHCDTYGIELYAENVAIARWHIKNLSIQMLGSNVAEKALYFHRGATNTITNFIIEYADITKAGATTPTTCIDIGTGCSKGALYKTRDASVGAISIVSSVAYEDFDKIHASTIFTDGDTTPSLQGGTTFEAANTTGAADTTITGFDDIYVGQRAAVKFATSSTTIDFTASSLYGNTGADWSPSTNDWMECVAYTAELCWCSCHDCTP